MKRILVADNNKMNRFILRAMLSDTYDVVEAGSNMEVQSLLFSPSANFSAMLLATDMYDISGAELLKMVRSDVLTATLPVIITADVYENIEQQMLKAGANDYITKPFHPIIIKQRLQNVITLRETAISVNSARMEKRQRQQLMLLESEKRMNDARNEFLSRMSHDMRTPLNAIIGLTGLAMEEKTVESMLSYVRDIDGASRYLLGLINDMLDFTRIENGQISFHEEPYSIEEFEHSIRTIIQPLMDAKNIAFTCKFYRGPEVLCVDKLRYNQIFFNLLSNAVKFTPPGGKVLLLSEELPIDYKGRYGRRFFVRDNGCGMSPQFLKVIYDPFTQEKNNVHINAQGTGLGMAIVKKLVDSMGGRIEVKSVLGKGTEFALDVYAYGGFAEHKEGSRIDEKTVDFTGMHILLAEDNALNIIVARKILEKRGCVLDLAINGQECVDLFLKMPQDYYQLILMDIRMPKMDGLRAAETIRGLARPDGATIPIIALSANTFEEDIQKSKDAGMNEHLCKPLDKHQLFTAMAKYVKK